MIFLKTRSTGAAVWAQGFCLDVPASRRSSLLFPQTQATCEASTEAASPSRNSEFTFYTFSLERHSVHALQLPLERHAGQASAGLATTPPKLFPRGLFRLMRRPGLRGSPRCSGSWSASVVSGIPLCPGPSSPGDEGC